MQIISRFLAYLPHSDRIPQPVRDALNTAVERLRLERMRTAPCFFACDTVAGANSGHEPSVIADVWSGGAPADYAVPASDGMAIEALHEWLERDFQAYNLIVLSEREMRLESDPMGLKALYIADIGGGTVLGSSIVTLLTAFPDLARPADDQGIYELMKFRAPMRDRTLHQRIKRTLAGGCYRWNASNGLGVSRSRRLYPPAVNGSLLNDELLPAARSVAMQSLVEKTERCGKPLALALSGGFDSRLLAALAREAGLPVDLYSFGNRHHPELRRARAVASALDVEVTEVPYPADNALKWLPLHLETVEGTADLATTSIANLFAIPGNPGMPLIHGFWGDPLAGNHLGHMTAEEYANADTLASGIMRFYGASTSFSPGDLFVTEFSMEQERESLRDDLIPDCPAHQAYSIWDLENRQRRYVGSYFAMLGTRMKPVMPFYDRKLFDLWLSVPPVGLENRAIFRSMLARYYPALARIPHSEEPGPIIPNLRFQLPGFCRQLPSQIMTGMFGDDLMQKILLKRYRDPYIWSLGNLAAPQQRRHMMETIQSGEMVLDEVLGVTLSDGYKQHLADNTQATRALFLMSKYAYWLRETL